jgi:hypothetical protein
MNHESEIIRQYLRTIGSKGGKARAATHDKATLSKWAKKGGRPRKEAAK